METIPLHSSASKTQPWPEHPLSWIQICELTCGPPRACCWPLVFNTPTNKPKGYYKVYCQLLNWLVCWLWQTNQNTLLKLSKSQSSNTVSKIESCQEKGFCILIWGCNMMSVNVWVVLNSKWNGECSSSKSWKTAEGGLWCLHYIFGRW